MENQYIDKELAAEAGLIHEIEPLGLMDKVARENLVAADGFNFPEGWSDMKSGIALSLFTHLFSCRARTANALC